MRKTRSSVIGAVLLGTVLLSGLSRAQAPLRDAAEAAPQNERPTATPADAAPQAEPSTATPADAALQGEEPVETGELAPDRPPLSTYDRVRQENNEPLEEERSLTSQLIRTVFALAIVVGLIYLIFKLGLGRLLQGGGVPGLTGKSSREIKVVERTMLDGKNAVIMLELGGQRRILVGTGERGVSYLCDIDPGINGHAPPGDDSNTARPSFSDVLEATAKESHEA